MYSGVIPVSKELNILSSHWSGRGESYLTNVIWKIKWGISVVEKKKNTYPFLNNGHIITREPVWLVVFYDKSTFVGYLMPNLVIYVGDL